MNEIDEQNKRVDELAAHARIAYPGVIALNLGCGVLNVDVEGFDKTINVDFHKDVAPDLVSDVFKVWESEEVKGRKVGLVYMSHVLEHFVRSEGRRLLAHIAKNLIPGGKIWIKVPNLEYASIQILRDGVPSPMTMDILYGHQEYESNFHKIGFTPRSLREFLLEQGLFKIESCEAIGAGEEIELKGEVIR